MLTVWILSIAQMANPIPMPHPGPLLVEKSQGRVNVDARELSVEREATELDRSVVAMLTSGTTAEPDVQSKGILDLVRSGLPFVALENLVQAVGAPQGEIARVVGMPATTLGRRRRSGRLTPTESDHVVRVARLAALARELMAGDSNAASDWMTTPHRLLGDETPLCHASTEAGGREVEQLIGQLLHGVFS